MTGIWEKRLHDISVGKEDYNKFIVDIEQTVRKWYDMIAGSEAKAYVSETKQLVCPFCNKKVIKGKFSYFCSGQKDTGCKFSIGTEI